MKTGNENHGAFGTIAKNARRFGKKALRKGRKVAAAAAGFGIAASAHAQSTLDLSDATSSITTNVGIVVAGALAVVGGCALVPVAIKAGKMIIRVGSSMFR